MENKKLIIWSSFIFLMLAWGSSFILVKKALLGGMTAFEVASVRMLSASLVLLIPALFFIKHIPKEKMPYIILSTLLSMFIPAYLFATAQVYIKESSLVSILNALTPAFTFIIGILLYRQPVLKMQVLGLILGFLGSVLLIIINTKGQLSLNHYAFLVLGATLCYGTNVNLVKYTLSDIKPIHLSSVTVAFTGLFAIIYLLFSQSFTHLSAVMQSNPRALGAVGLLGVMGTAASQIVFNKMLSYTSSVFASAITYFIPIVALFWGIVDGEVLSLWHFVGMGLIIGGIFILNKSK
jgi:drug/metabolite transporter (DMT)-like permease